MGNHSLDLPSCFLALISGKCSTKSKNGVFQRYTGTTVQPPWKSGNRSRPASSCSTLLQVSPRMRDIFRMFPFLFETRKSSRWQRRYLGRNAAQVPHTAFDWLSDYICCFNSHDSLAKRFCQPSTQSKLGLGDGKMSCNAIRLGICRILSRGCQLRCKCADPRNRASEQYIVTCPNPSQACDGLPAGFDCYHVANTSEAAIIYITPALMKLGTFDFFTHGKSKGVGSGGDLNRHGWMKDGYGWLWLLWLILRYSLRLLSWCPLF